MVARMNPPPPPTPPKVEPKTKPRFARPAGWPSVEELHAEARARSQVHARRMEAQYDHVAPTDTVAVLARQRADALVAKKPGHDRTVQLAVRMPEALRDLIHEVAKRHEQSVQDFVRDAVIDAMDRLENPNRAFAERMTRHTQSILAKAFDNGLYDEAIAAITADDPEIADS